MDSANQNEPSLGTVSVDERYYVQYDKMTNEWEVWENNGKFCFPTFICSSDNKESCLFIRDALNSFPHTVEDYLSGTDSD